jgi:hypothetical protein
MELPGGAPKMMIFFAWLSAVTVEIGIETALIGITRIPAFIRR